MPSLTSQQLTELGNLFLDFANTVDDYRINNKNSISSAHNHELKDLHDELCKHSEDFFATSAIVIMDEVETSMNTIRDVTNEINETYNKLRKVQKAIDVAAAGVTLASAFFSKDPRSIKDAVTGFVSTWRDDE